MARSFGSESISQGKQMTLGVIKDWVMDLSMLSKPTSTN
jgi:hypothetical protein